MAVQRTVEGDLAMKMNTPELMQLVNATLMLGFCVSYPLFHLNSYYAKLGIVIWAFALPIIYFPDLMIIPGVPRKEMRDAKKISIPAGWLWVLWCIGDLTDIRELRIIAGVFLIVFIAYLIFLVRKRRNMYSVTGTKHQNM